MPIRIVGLPLYEIVCCRCGRGAIEDNDLFGAGLKFGSEDEANDWAEENGWDTDPESPEEQTLCPSCS